MAENTPTMEAEKQEVTATEGTERTRDTRVFAPRADIYETDKQIVVVVDVPGADEGSIDINLEKNILTINALVEPNFPENYHLAFAEYEIGDYQRSFRLSNEIDREKIEATVKDGVLRLYLPKAAAAQARKINVKSA